MKKDENRAQVGKRAGLVGILCNFILAIGKLLIGTLSSSVSIVADGINNLSDAAASGITLIGFHFSKKPADKKHPYGHARYEYLSALVISALILVAGFELASSSVDRLLHPKSVSFSALTVAALIFSIAVKLFLVFFYGKSAKKIGSETLSAAKIDSRNDVLATSVVLLSLFLEQIFTLPIDALCGISLSLFILYSGMDMAKKTISPLLGENGDTELKEKILEKFRSSPSVIGCHDLLIHDYGPEKRYATLHVEMDQNADPMESHGLLDLLERECRKEYGVHLVTHLDPISPSDPETEVLRKKIDTLLKMRDNRFETHDFRVLMRDDFCEVSLDVTIPEDCKEDAASLAEELSRAMTALDGVCYRFHITLDL